MIPILLLISLHKILLGIIVTIGYLTVGAVISGFASDDPNTPPLLPLFAGLFWPLFIAGLIIYYIGEQVYLWIIYTFFGIHIFTDIHGNKCVRHRKDQILMQGFYVVYADYKEDIERKINEYLLNNIYGDDFRNDFLNSPLGQFYSDLILYQDGKIDTKEMLEKHVSICLNLEKILKYDWCFNIKQDTL